MDGRGILRHYNLVNISGEDIDIILTSPEGEDHIFVFEKDEIIHGVLPRTVEIMWRADSNILRFVRIEPVWAKELVRVNWKEEGF